MALLRAATAAAIVVLVLVSLLASLQRRLIYFPDSRPAPQAATVLPGGEDVTFATADGLLLAGWFLPARGPATGTTAVVFNGNAGDRSARAPLADALATAGVSVLLFDYRGYAGNPGRPSEEGLALDARAARAHVLRQPGVRADSLVYFGESIGAAVAIGLAAEHPPAALVLRSPFTSLADVGRMHYPFLPVRRLLRDHYDSLGRIRGVRCPVLVVAGGGDTIVPPSQSRALYDAAAMPKRYVEIPGVDHNAVALLSGDRLLREVLDFVRTHVRRSPGAAGR